MRNIFTKLFAVAAMMVMSLTAQNAKAATVSDLVAIDHDWAFIADVINANGTEDLSDGTLYAGDRILSLGGNTKATNKGSNTIDGVSHLNSMRVKGTQNRLAFKVSGACAVTFYTQIHGERGLFVSKTDNVTTAEAAYATEPYSSSVWNVNLDEAGVYYVTSNGDLFIAGFIVEMVKDPAREYTFGYSAALDGTTLSSTLTKQEDGCATITAGDFVSTYNLLGGKIRDVYHGSETAYQIDLPFRNLVSNTTTISTQNGDENGAENHGAYLGYSLTIEEGSKISLTEISTDIYVADKSNWSYEYVIEDGDGNQLYKSLVQTIAAARSGSDHTKTLHLYSDDVQNLTGVVNVKLIWWINSSSTYLAIKDFKVKGIKHEVVSQTKNLKRIDVNGVQYDYENEGNSISTLLHAAPSVKFYYDVVNNWSDGSETVAEDEEETVVASVSAGNYVATTTLATTPYSLTFTNVDLPKVFGITRAVANETSTASNTTTTAYKLSEDAIVDPSVTGVSVAINYGSQDALTNSVRTFTWYNGTEAITCYAETGEKSYSNRFNNGVEVVAVTELNENCFYGFDLTVALGYKLSISSINADVMKNGEHAHYQIKVYNNGTLIKTLDEVVATNKASSDMRLSVNTVADEALQDLTGTVTLKMFFWDEAANKYIEIKDFNVTAAVDANPGEGINTLSFVSFESAAHPEFTNGEVTAVFSNSANNVSPASNDRGIRMQGTYSYEMKLSVPEDSYISEVVFVWNNNGNPGANGNCLNLTVTNDVNQVVGTLTDKKVSNEKAWTCGDVRESELTFAQGDGDFYLNSIRVTYLKKDADPDKSYTRTHAHMNLNTLCFPYTVTAYTGGTFYEMLYKRVESSVPVEVVLVEHEGNLVAGTPYFYMPEGSQLEFTYSGHRENTPSKVNGVQGIYDAQPVPSGSFVAYNGEIRAVGSNVTLKEYRAYIDMDAVSEQVVTPAPGRRILRISNADAPAVTTDVESIQHSEFSIQKVLRNGQLFIIRDGKTYNVQGQLLNR